MMRQIKYRAPFRVLMRLRLGVDPSFPRLDNTSVPVLGRRGVINRHRQGRQQRAQSFESQQMTETGNRKRK